jgi:hypothetical protein
MGNRLTYPNFKEMDEIIKNDPEIKKMQAACDTSKVASLINDHLMENLKTAVDKEFVSDLTPDEASAICYFTGANGTWVDGKLRFENCQLYKRDGKWGVYQYE